jgi:putative heme-binding domain-containing protein
LLTKEDQVLSGLVAFEDDQRIELVVAADKRVSIEKRDVAQRSSSNTSLMPAGIDKVLTIQELSDLIAFLEQSK